MEKHGDQDGNLLTTLCEKKDCDFVVLIRGEKHLRSLNHSLRKEGLRRFLEHDMCPLFLLLTTLCEKKDCDWGNGSSRVFLTSS